MKGKWAKGIAPRFFAWIIKDKLAVSERPGGYARNHRRVRRQEEILWLRGEGFTRVVSLLTSPHNLHAYDELDMAWAHIPFSVHDDPAVALPELYSQLRNWMANGERLLVHHEELSDRLMGVVAGYLRWSGLVPSGPQAISVVERILHRQMGPEGRELVAMAPQLAGAGGVVLAGVGSRTTVSAPRPRSGVAPRAVPSPVATSSGGVASGGVGSGGGGSGVSTAAAAVLAALGEGRAALGSLEVEPPASGGAPGSGGHAPASEPPGPESPASESPGPESPVSDSPGLESPGSESPGSESPALESPGLESPGLESPGLESPALEERGEGGIAAWPEGDATPSKVWVAAAVTEVDELHPL